MPSVHFIIIHIYVILLKFELLTITFNSLNCDFINFNYNPIINQDNILKYTYYSY